MTANRNFVRFALRSLCRHFMSYACICFVWFVCLINKTVSSYLFIVQVQVKKGSFNIRLVRTTLSLIRTTDFILDIACIAQVIHESCRATNNNNNNMNHAWMDPSC